MDLSKTVRIALFGNLHRTDMRDQLLELINYFHGKNKEFYPEFKLRLDHIKNEKQ